MLIVSAAREADSLPYGVVYPLYVILSERSEAKDPVWLVQCPGDSSSLTLLRMTACDIGSIGPGGGGGFFAETVFPAQLLGRGVEIGSGAVHAEDR